VVYVAAPIIEIMDRGGTIRNKLIKLYQTKIYTTEILNTISKMFSIYPVHGTDIDKEQKVCHNMSIPPSYSQS
jgi:hypothetical protein